MEIKSFNIRVYGICINAKNQVLLSDEKYGTQYFTKFPGGGLEYGEGAIDCLQREWREELNAEIDVVSHFYTTDIFVPNAFNATQQILSIYYLVRLISPITFPVSISPLPLNAALHQTQAQRWIGVQDIQKDMVNFAIDKMVITMLKNQFL
jgi:8-oxo-dGTP diphosphatase